MQTQRIIARHEEEKNILFAKLDIRDHFAGLAMQGLLSADPENKWDADDCAYFAYQQADAMLKQRSKSDELG